VRPSNAVSLQALEHRAILVAETHPARLVLVVLPPNRALSRNAGSTVGLTVTLHLNVKERPNASRNRALVMESVSCPKVSVVYILIPVTAVAMGKLVQLVLVDRPVQTLMKTLLLVIVAKHRQIAIKIRYAFQKTPGDLLAVFSFVIPMTLKTAAQTRAVAA
jgi:hypothetical protein